MPSIVCEVCGKPITHESDMLCSECLRYFAILTGLLAEHPKLNAPDFNRLEHMFNWWDKKRTQLKEPTPS
jgi:predicted amidophosphoribosyltransferase